MPPIERSNSVTGRDRKWRVIMVGAGLGNDGNDSPPIGAPGPRLSGNHAALRRSSGDHQFFTELPLAGTRGPAASAGPTKTKKGRTQRVRPFVKARKFS